MKKQILATDQIANINNGFFDSELGQAIAEAVAAVLKHGRKATVTAKLEISVQNLSNGTVKIMHDVKSTLPKEKREGGILFVTPEGNLTPNDPAQIKLALQSIETPQQAPLRAVK